MTMKRTPKKSSEPKRIVVAENLTEYQYDDEEQTLLLTTSYNGKQYMLFGIKRTKEGAKVAQVKAEDLPEGFDEETWIDAQLWFANKAADLIEDDDDKDWQAETEQ
jgi:hypothetical protein